jgi:hypothetical protein
MQPCKDPAIHVGNNTSFIGGRRLFDRNTDVLPVKQITTKIFILRETSSRGDHQEPKAFYANGNFRTSTEKNMRLKEKCPLT